MAKRTLDESIREKMYGLLPFSRECSIWHTPRQFKNKELPEEFIPKFKQRGFNTEEGMGVRKLYNNGSKPDEKALKEYARKSVIGWEQLFDAGSCEEIEYKASSDGSADPDLFSKIPVAIVSDLLFNAVRISGLIDEEKLGLN